MNALLANKWAKRAQVCLWLALVAVCDASASLPACAAATGTALVLDISGPIAPASSDYVTRGLKRAAQDEARIVILRIDTPGGLDTSMREIIRAILASPVPVAAYVAPSGARAASAGTYIAYASHVAAMAPGTNIGAATPVAIGLGAPSGDDGEKPPAGNPGSGATGQSAQPSPPTMEVKVANDAAAYIRSLAELRNRNADWAERAVRQAASLPATDAEKQHVVDFTATDIGELLEKANGKTVSAGGREIILNTRELTIVPLAPDWRNRALGIITDPNVALIFMMVGFYGLIFEFMNPGTFLPGVAGAISLIIGFYALAILPVTFAGLGLILLGTALMIAEAFTPSFGALGVGGVIAFLTGAGILIDPDSVGFGIDWRVIAALVAVSLGLSLLVIRLAVTSRRHPVVTGAEELIGSRGEVQDWAGAKGHVFVHGEYWNAVSAKPLAPGRNVRVTGIDGLTLTVDPFDPDKPSGT